MTLRHIVGTPVRGVVRQSVRLRTRGWPEHSRLFAVGERSGWSVDDDARHLEATARRLGHTVAPEAWARYSDGQSVFLTSHFAALQQSWLDSSHRVATAYLHGRPGTVGYPEFDFAFERLRANPDRFLRIQVTHDEMHDLVVSAGVDPERIFRIPIGIDVENFPLVTAALRDSARAALRLPPDAFVAGSFQKDGVGWGEGLEPKLVKGPDVLVAALEQIRGAVPELFVLLTGPARGYVRGELERLGIPYRHLRAHSRSELARAYYALDVCVVASRQEGGPKAALESLAAGIPLVTTRVGQAQDVVEDGVNGRLVDIEDVDAIADALMLIHDDEALRDPLVEAGRATAERYAHELLDADWKLLLAGFVGSRHPD